MTRKEKLARIAELARELSEQTLTYCAEHPDDRGVVHGFCL